MSLSRLHLSRQSSLLRLPCRSRRLLLLHYCQSYLLLQKKNKTHYQFPFKLNPFK
jgi:hypothetical protein